MHDKKSGKTWVLRKLQLFAIMNSIVVLKITVIST